MLASTPFAVGPVEASILEDLAPAFSVHFTDGDVPLRVLAGGEGPPLVLLHARGGAATCWLPLLPALAQSHRVLAVDLPGFGASAAPLFDGGGFDEAISAFAGPVEAWLARASIEAPVLVGHSLGALVAVELVLRRRVQPARLVLIAGMGLGAQMSMPSRLFFRAGPERLARTLGPTLFRRVLDPKGAKGDGRMSALAYELHAARDRRAAARAFDALYPMVGPAPNRKARLDGIDVPVLLLWGDHDEVFPSPVAIAAAAAFPRSQLRIGPYGHSPHIEAPMWVLPIVTECLTGRGLDRR